MVPHDISGYIPGDFYLYAIMKNRPNQEATKKLFRTAMSNFIFGYTRVPFRPHSVHFLPFTGSDMWVPDNTMSLLPFQSLCPVFTRANLLKWFSMIHEFQSCFLHSHQWQYASFRCVFPSKRGKKASDQVTWHLHAAHLEA